uniref:Uncharacterized protein n=1 Tax=Knipowitschia caucasica TaxID=637954 RepID=A0AAV2KF96_KNICA
MVPVPVCPEEQEEEEQEEEEQEEEEQEEQEEEEQEEEQEEAWPSLSCPSDLFFNREALTKASVCVCLV